MTDGKTILEFIRVKQWYKNVIIFLPLIFTLEFFAPEKFLIILIGFFVLSLVSSAAYVRNDIKDLEQDRKHPIKKLRALPSGLLSIKHAWIIFTLLITMGFGIGTILDVSFVFILVLFFVNTEIYSRWTKKIIFLDAFSIGISFIIRAISGIILLQVPLSPWIILGVFFVALFLAFIKRKGELILLENDAQKHREILKDYSIFSLNALIIISAVMVIITYSLYSMIGPNDDWRLIITVPFIIFIIFRQIHLSDINDKILQSTDFFKDKQSVYALVAFGILTIVLLYFVPSELFYSDF